jgi:hypothetical protein
LPVSRTTPTLVSIRRRGTPRSSRQLSQDEKRWYFRAVEVIRAMPAALW